MFKYLHVFMYIHICVCVLYDAVVFQGQGCEHRPRLSAQHSQMACEVHWSSSSSRLFLLAFLLFLCLFFLSFPLLSSLLPSLFSLLSCPSSLTFPFLSLRISSLLSRLFSCPSLFDWCKSIEEGAKTQATHPCHGWSPCRQSKPERDKKCTVTRRCVV